MRSLIASTLEEMGVPLKITEASTGFEALRVLPRGSYDLIVTDINMPDINGLELVSFVKGNQAYLAVILLARVITRLGSLPDINTGIIERLFSADFAYLQDFYRRINENGTATVATTCPVCKHEFEVDLGDLGES